MTAGPASVHLDADVHEVAATMFEFGCRHLPVVTDDGERVLGMVSIRDLLGTTYRFAERP
jgi:CBS domain-containing protein